MRGKEAGMTQQDAAIGITPAYAGKSSATECADALN